MTTKPVDYKALHSELDSLLNDLQAGELTIDEALVAFKRGQVIIELLDDYLETSKNTVSKLISK